MLQRGPQRASLYGSVALADAGSALTLTLSSAPGSSGAPYSKSFPATAAADGTWKLLLDAMPAGGNFSATLRCSSCSSGRKSVTIVDLTFGDVIYAFGQSNLFVL